MSSKPVIVLNFDDVVYDYSSVGWEKDKLSGEPLEGVNEAIEELSDTYKVVIYSNRCKHKTQRNIVKEWLNEHITHYDELVYDIPPHYVFISPKAKSFPRRWKEEFIDDLIAMNPDI